jgi:hypothetical protein
VQAGNNNRNYVGIKTNLRKLAVHVFAPRSDIALRVDVRESLVLANDLLCYRNGLPCCRVGRALEAA